MDGHLILLALDSLEEQLVVLLQFGLGESLADCVDTSEVGFDLLLEVGDFFSNFADSFFEITSKVRRRYLVDSGLDLFELVFLVGEQRATIFCLVYDALRVLGDFLAHILNHFFPALVGVVVHFALEGFVHLKPQLLQLHQQKGVFLIQRLVASVHLAADKPISQAVPEGARGSAV